MTSIIETLAEARDNRWRITAQKTHEMIEYSGTLFRLGAFNEMTQPSPVDPAPPPERAKPKA
jgi:hypothetical protein